MIILLAFLADKSVLHGLNLLPKSLATDVANTSPDDDMLLTLPSTHTKRLLKRPFHLLRASRLLRTARFQYLPSKAEPFDSQRCELAHIGGYHFNTNQVLRSFSEPFNATLSFFDVLTSLQRRWKPIARRS